MAVRLCRQRAALCRDLPQHGYEPSDVFSRPECLPGRFGTTLLRLLQERALSSSGEWRSQIQAMDRDVLHQLQHNIAGGFDQDRFGPCIGFGNLKRLPQAPALPKTQI